MVIDLGRKRVRVLVAGVSSSGGGQVRVKRALIEEIPDDISFENTAALGGWLGSRLAAARIKQGQAIVSIGREHVGVKRMTLPTIDDAELPDMTRLAMHRELPFDADTAVIDFVPVERTATNTTVLAVAAPRSVIEHAKAVVAAAGLAVERITLRTMGAAAILSTHLAPESSGLAIDVMTDGVEFCLILDRTIRFSRAAEVPKPQDDLSIADAVVTETRRTWMSYRSGDEASTVPAALILGDHRIGKYALAPLAEILKVPVQVLGSHARIANDESDMDRFWPLAGLLLELPTQKELIDFNKPRHAPDLAARTRIRRMLAAAAVLLCLGVLWTLARLDLENLRRTASMLADRQSNEVRDYARHWRDKYKLEHLKQWESIGVDWLQHASYLTTIAPAPGQVVLDQWNGTLQTHGVQYNKKSDKWSAEEEMTIVLDGEALTRETADAFRENLVQTSIYTTSTTGADKMGGKRLPYGFMYRLRTKARTVATEVAATAKKPETSTDSATTAKVDGASSTEVAAQ
jgi:hypothetical protein